MSNTRTAYTDLKVGFTIGASTDPNTTDAAADITDLYKQCYNAMFGNQSLYHATDDNIDSKYYNTFNTVVKRAYTRIVRGITESYKVGSTKERPEVKLDDSEIAEIQMAYGISISLPSHADEDLI